MFRTSQALIEPLQHEEQRRQKRVRHLEHLMQQWTEVFGSGGDGEFFDSRDPRLKTPLSLRQALNTQDSQIETLTAQLAEAKQVR